MRRIILPLTHLACLGIGFMLGIYMLPILTAQKSPDAKEIAAASTGTEFKGRFDRNMKGSDFLHWGEGDVRLSRQRIVHEGKLSPGPDFRLYLSPEFVDTSDGFKKIKAQSKAVAEIKSYSGFIVDVPPGVDVAAFNTVVIWCEAFNVIISAAKYR
ncbi:MAG: hypothetical protein RL291_669 [Pseudomonadota bacterium]|jgi:hypothetical protein